jgi:hypothetical protein
MTTSTTHHAEPGYAGVQEASCAVCGAPVRPGNGLAATYRGRTLHVGCSTCRFRFEAEPDRYLDHGPADDGCPDCWQAAEAESPASEWACY